MKKNKKKLSLQKISIAQIGNTNKIKGGTFTTFTYSHFSCLKSFEIDTDISINNCNNETQTPDVPN